MRQPLAHAACPLALALALLCAAAACAEPFRGREFDSEQAARRECRGDEVVWLDPPTGRWFRKGNGWYEGTLNGVYVCRAEAERGGRPAVKKRPAPPPPPNDDED